MKSIVYKHIRLDTNTTFYIGKGSIKRSKDRWGRNKYWHRIVKTTGYRIEIVASGLTHDEAYTLEARLISLYKRYGRCEANFALGGTGPASVSEETKKKLGESGSGRAPWNKGKKGVQTVWNKGKKGTYKNPKVVEYWKTHQKNSPPNKGTTWSDSERAGIAKGKNLKPFQVIEQATGQVVWTGLWQTEAIKFLGLTLSSKGNINMCLNNIRKSHKNFLFQYLSDDSQTPVAS